ncbi:hypothetical protein [Clostridium sp. ZS2-4]|uniref:hypothetical protein n=1 Tax=Clostridium sp. ZS2-4 TaxID=2987703 RepID=UPI00227AD6ED|nr:hypothetical protein [Clostridium sp. ZS2-4]MCY6355398.1 hypothetical protein [Clostridium sp. ZS2-4]
MAVQSWSEFISSPSLSGFGWAVLDSAAVMPFLPSTAYFRKGEKFVIKLKELKKFAKTTKGAKIIKNSLKVVSKLGDIKSVRKLAKGYKMTEARYITHILYRHGPTSTASNTGKFVGAFDIKRAIDQVLKSPNSVVKPNSNKRPGYIFEKTYSGVIGYDGKKACKTIRVIIDEVGNVVTAFPVK